MRENVKTYLKICTSFNTMHTQSCTGQLFMGKKIHVTKKHIIIFCSFSTDPGPNNPWTADRENKCRHLPTYQNVLFYYCKMFKTLPEFTMNVVRMTSWRAIELIACKADSLTSTSKSFRHNKMASTPPHSLIRIKAFDDECLLTFSMRLMQFNL